MWTFTYTAWGFLTWNAASLPWWLVLAPGGIVVCLHGSLQHEALHGHPTRSPLINTVLALLPLGLWMPYAVYRDSHLAHHRCAKLTDPSSDPESFYVPASRWRRWSRWKQRIYELNNTLLGRMLLGPWLVVSTFWANTLRDLRAPHFPHRRAWVLHLVLLTLIGAWLAFCDVPLWLYVVGFAWPGLSLTLLRSYYEHRTAGEPDQQSVIVEGSWITRLLFLNNNFHAIHHARPGVPWYELPQFYWTQRDAVLENNGGFRYRGYGELWRYYGFRSKDSPVYCDSAVP
jgi:fatty acid desaturase